MKFQFVFTEFQCFFGMQIMSNINNTLDGNQNEHDGSLGSSLDPPEQANRPDPHFDEKMARLMRALNAENPSTLVKILGLSYGAYGSAKKTRQLPAKWLVIAFEKYGISSDWVLSGEGSMRRGETSFLPERCLSPDDFEIVPLLESRVTAGPEGEILYEEIADYYPFKKWWIERMVGKSRERKKNLLLIKVRGDSMSPTINQGEVALVDTGEHERIDIKVGKIYIVTMPDGSTAIKRLALSREEGRTKLICMSDNVAAYLPFEFELEAERPIQTYVIGRVRWAGKEFD